MGIVSSKDETGAVVAGSLRGKDILDYKGRDLRDKMDVCLSKHMWYWTIGGVVLSLPMCVMLKTQRPLFYAAMISPIADMMYATSKCEPEKEAFRKYYDYLKQQHAESIEKGFVEGADAPGPDPSALSLTASPAVKEAEKFASELQDQPSDDITFDDGLVIKQEKKKRGWLW